MDTRAGQAPHANVGPPVASLRRLIVKDVLNARPVAGHRKKNAPTIAEADLSPEEQQFSASNTSGLILGLGPRLTVTWSQALPSGEKLPGPSRAYSSDRRQSPNRKTGYRPQMSAFGGNSHKQLSVV